MAVNYYATETELENKTARTFDANSVITTTQIGLLLDELSSQLDGIMGEDEGHLGTSATCPEWAKQAVMSAAKMIVDAIYSDDIKSPSEEDIVKMLEKYATGRTSDQAQPRLFHAGKEQPTSGKW